MSIIVAPLLDIFAVQTCRVLCYNPQNHRSAFKNIHRLWKNVLLVPFSYILALPSIHRTIRYTYANTYTWINVFMHIYMQTHKDTSITLFPKKIKHIQDMFGFIIPYFFFLHDIFHQKSQGRTTSWWMQRKGESTAHLGQLSYQTRSCEAKNKVQTL